jgi:NAD(P) transhydrogenase subunit alpha
MEGESRVAATPETVARLKKTGASVAVEAGAGSGSLYPDEAYRKAGAEIFANVEELYHHATCILKVKEPLFNTQKNRHEVDMMHSGQYLVTFLHPAFPGNHDMIRMLASRGVTALTLDSIPRISRTQTMDALTSMSIVAGYKGMLIAADTLQRFIPIVGVASGVIQPSRVLVIGTGVAGLQAIATAKRLGAIVEGADIRRDAREQSVSLGAQVVDLNIPHELAEDKGGYASTLPGEWLQRERDMLKEHVSRADIMILSALVPRKIAPILVTADMVASMKPGSVIVDIAIDQGGNCELSEPGRTVVKNHVTIVGMKNIPGTMPLVATTLFAGNMLHLIEYLMKGGTLHIDKDDDIISPCLVTCNGEIVHQGTREAMNL